MARHPLQLFVSGASVNGQRARTNARWLCEHVEGGGALDVFDVREHPEAADRARVVATPALLYLNGDPPRRVIGDLSDLPRVLRFLGLTARADADFGAADVRPPPASPGSFRAHEFSAAPQPAAARTDRSGRSAG